jgi:hypothetical protein
MSLDVFISHSRKDAETAEALIELIRAATDIPHDKIRCSSVDGYRLQGGVTVDEQLKREVREARCFIGLITPNSMNSPYVLFELGARWGAHLHFVPLLAKGMTATDLRAPLSGLNALACSSTSQLHQLVTEVAQALDRPLASPAAYERHLQRLVSVGDKAISADTDAVKPEGVSTVQPVKPIEPHSVGARELLDLIRNESDNAVRGLVEIASQPRPGEIHFFPKLQYAGTPLTSKARLFREAVDELIKSGWLFPPEAHAATNTRTYEYRGDSDRPETVLVATSVETLQAEAPSTYPLGVSIPGRPGFVFSPYALGSGYVDIRGFPQDTLVRCPYSGKIFRAP